MIKPKVSIRGQKLLAENCKKLAPKARRAVEEASIKAAFMIRNTAVTLCPVDTNRLRGSLSVNWTDSDMDRGKVTGNVKIGKSGKPPKPLVPEDGVGQPLKGLKGFYASIGTNVEYAEPVENNISPYLWPAFTMNKEKYLAMLAAILKVELSTLKPVSGGKASFFGRPL